MSKIDEIMTAVDLDATDAEIRTLIAAALADAERKGAEEMRMLAARTCGLNAIDMDTRDQVRGALNCEHAIRALPLTTGSQPAEAKPGEWVEWKGGDCPIADGVPFSLKFRSGKVVEIDDCAGAWRWTKKRYGGDIIAYRVLP